MAHPIFGYLTRGFVIAVAIVIGGTDIIEQLPEAEQALTQQNAVRQQNARKYLALAARFGENDFTKSAFVLSKDVAGQYDSDGKYKDIDSMAYYMEQQHYSELATSRRTPQELVQEEGYFFDRGFTDAERRGDRILFSRLPE